MTLLNKTVIFSLMILSIFPLRAEAIWVHLNETQRGEAISYGMRNLNADSKVFFKEWTIDLGTSGVAILNTEFITLANAARDSALGGEELDNYGIEDVLAKAQGKLVFTVYVFGKNQDFAKDYEGVVKVAGKTYPATYWEEGEINPSESQKGMFIQELFYYFPMGEISPESQVTLQVGNPSQKEKIQFNLDLNKMR